MNNSMTGKRLFRLAGVLLASFLLLGAGNDQERFEKVGHRLMCSCGCSQVLLECNHVGCPLSDGMRNELKAGLNSFADDHTVLQIFVNKYGPVVLAAPTMTGFNRVAWVMPYAMFIGGIGLVLFVARNWRAQAITNANAYPVGQQITEAVRERIRRETEQ